MIFLQGKNQLSLRNTTTSAQVGPTWYAKLAYYANCCQTCISSTNISIPILARTDYSNWLSFSKIDKLDLLQFCTKKIPLQKVTNRFFLKKEECLINQFLEVTDSKDILGMGISGDTLALIQSKEKQVVTVMLYSSKWANRNYYTPVIKGIKYLEEITDQDQDSVSSYRKSSDQDSVSNDDSDQASREDSYSSSYSSISSYRNSDCDSDSD